MADLSIKERVARVENQIHCHHDFPKPGIVFRDVFPLMKDPQVFADCILLLVEHIKSTVGHVDVVAGLDSRGFIFAPMIAQHLNAAFVPIRKAGKLPGQCVSATYQLEYGSDTFEAQVGSITQGQKVVIVDDLLATGGTMSAAVKLMTEMGADIRECVVIIELTELKGRDKFSTKLFSLLSY